MNEGQSYAARWIEVWNRMDLDAALTLWAEGVEFWSPLAEELTGSPVLYGKGAVAAYWRDALASSGHLQFELVEAYWDEPARTVTILYRRERRDDLRLAAEIVRLGSEGLGVHGMALHGAKLRAPRTASCNQEGLQ
jgi:hypothetical protein